MQQKSLSFIIQPYKNSLLDKKNLQNRIKLFFEEILSVCNTIETFKLAVVLPGYLLEGLNGSLKNKLTALTNKHSLELITSGYSDILLESASASFTRRNLSLANNLIEKNSSYIPLGFAAPLSKIAPATVPLIADMDYHYMLASEETLDEEYRRSRFLLAEGNGTTIPLILYETLYESSTENIIDFVQNRFDKEEDATKHHLVLKIKCPIDSEDNNSLEKCIKNLAEQSEALAKEFTYNTPHEILNQDTPEGVISLDSLKPISEEVDIPVRNELYKYDTIGLLQRKLNYAIRELDSYKKMLPPNVEEEILKKISLVQDIHRLSPSKTNGFIHIEDRLWSFANLAKVEHVISNYYGRSHEKMQIRDYLQNGTKTLILSNKTLRAFIDFAHGGHIIELDSYERYCNIFSAFNPKKHSQPHVCDKEKSLRSFVDYAYLDNNSEIIVGKTKSISDLTFGEYNYKLRRNKAGVNALLSRDVTMNIDNSDHLFRMEKYFGFEKDKPEMTFAYNFMNDESSDVSFRLGVQFHISLPGGVDNELSLIHKTEQNNDIAFQKHTLADTDQVGINDSLYGISVTIQFNENVDITIAPVSESNAYSGLSISVLKRMSLLKQTASKLVGKIIVKKTKARKEFDDVI